MTPNRDNQDTEVFFVKEHNKKDVSGTVWIVHICPNH